MDDAAIKMEQLQKWRSRRKKDLSIDSVMHTFCGSLRKTNKQLLQIQEAWKECVPARLHHVAIPISLRSGILEVSVDGSPTAFQMNRLIRSGLLRKLQKTCCGTLKQIRVRIER
jgi:predicted nucleic acid-binding Zn ribbon protein